jgi:hypothetical protein
MPTDGDCDFSGYSGAQLLEALDSIDRSRYPKNFTALREELGGRPAPGRHVLEGSAVVELSSLRPAERSTLVRACVLRAFFLQLQFQFAGAVVGALAGLLFRALLSAAGASWAAGVVSITVALVMFFMSFAAYWAYTKWLLHEAVGSFTFRLLRLQGDGT